MTTQYYTQIKSNQNQSDHNQPKETPKIPIPNTIYSLHPIKGSTTPVGEPTHSTLGLHHIWREVPWQLTFIFHLLSRSHAFSLHE